jgi:hypothetical protein
MLLVLLGEELKGILEDIRRSNSLFCLKMYDRMLSKVTQHPEMIIKSAERITRFSKLPHHNLYLSSLTKSIQTL